MADVVTTTNNAGVTSAGAYRNICEKYASENSEVNPVEKTTCNSLSTSITVSAEGITPAGKVLTGISYPEDR